MFNGQMQENRKIEFTASHDLMQSSMTAMRQTTVPSRFQSQYAIVCDYCNTRTKCRKRVQSIAWYDKLVTHERENTHTTHTTTWL